MYGVWYNVKFKVTHSRPPPYLKLWRSSPSVETLLEALTQVKETSPPLVLLSRVMLFTYGMTSWPHRSEEITSHLIGPRLGATWWGSPQSNASNFMAIRKSRMQEALPVG